jgi:hypothetical protein
MRALILMKMILTMALTSVLLIATTFGGEFPDSWKNFKRYAIKHKVAPVSVLSSIEKEYAPKQGFCSKPSSGPGLYSAYFPVRDGMRISFFEGDDRWVVTLVGSDEQLIKQLYPK